MSRKYELEKFALEHLNRIRCGSFHTKKTRRNVLIKLIDDLTSIKRLPSSLSKITSEDIIALVNFWKKKELKEGTITSRLGLLRSVNKLTQWGINIPKNANLGLKRYVATRKTTQNEPLEIKRLSHPITRNVFALQAHFGLTQSEAIHLDPNLISHTHALIIMKNISHNNKERYIPILSDAQKNIIEERRSLCDDSFTKIMPLHMINQLIRAELVYLKIKSSPDFRSLYTKKRVAVLGSDKKQAIKTLMKETGITKSKQIYEFLAS